MNRVLNESFRQAPGRPSREVWCCRLVKHPANYELRFFSQGRLQKTDGREFYAASELTGSFQAATNRFQSLVAEKEREGWNPADPAEWEIERWLGEVWEMPRAGKPWQPTQWTASAADQALSLLKGEQYLLQRWYDRPLIRVVLDGPHSMALYASGEPAILTERLWTTLKEWQYSRGDLDLEAFLAPGGDHLILSDRLDPPGRIRSTTDRLQEMDLGMLPRLIYRSPAGYSSILKHQLWQAALNPTSDWDGVILRRADAPHLPGPSHLEFRVDLRHEGLYLVEHLHPKSAGGPRRLTIGFPTIEGGWQSLGPVSGRSLSPADWATLEQFRECHVDAVVRVRYAWWDPETQQLAGGKVLRLEPRLCRADCIDAGADLITGTHYLF